MPSSSITCSQVHARFETHGISNHHQQVATEPQYLDELALVPACFKDIEARLCTHDDVQTRLLNQQKLVKCVRRDRLFYRSSSQHKVL